MLEKITASQWLGAGALTVLGGLGGKLIDALVKLVGDKKADTADQTRALAEWDRAVSEGGAELLNQFRAEFKFLRAELVRANGEIATLGGRVAAIAEQHRDCEARLKASETEIARLMAGPVASYPGGQT